MTTLTCILGVTVLGCSGVLHFMAVDVCPRKASLWNRKKVWFKVRLVFEVRAFKFYPCDFELTT